MATTITTKVKGAPDRLLSIQEVSMLLQVPVATLYQWRFRGEGPPGKRVGRYVRYDPGDLSRWLRSRREVR